LITASPVHICGAGQTAARPSPRPGRPDRASLGSGCDPGGPRRHAAAPARLCKGSLDRAGRRPHGWTDWTIVKIASYHHNDILPYRRPRPA
jgi:hypothetical protein